MNDLLLLLPLPVFQTGLLVGAVAVILLFLLAFALAQGWIWLNDNVTVTIKRRDRRWTSTPRGY